MLLKVYHKGKMKLKNYFFAAEGSAAAVQAGNFTD